MTGFTDYSSVPPGRYRRPRVKRKSIREARRRPQDAQNAPMLSVKGAAAFFVVTLVLVMTGTPNLAQQGTVARTPVGPMELPIEVEIELSPAGSLKQAAVWKELYQLLRIPTRSVVLPTIPPLTRREQLLHRDNPAARGFRHHMPPLRIYSPGYNFLTAQPLRRRTSDGEVSWISRVRCSTRRKTSEPVRSTNRSRCGPRSGTSWRARTSRHTRRRISGPSATASPTGAWSSTTPAAAGSSRHTERSWRRRPMSTENSSMKTGSRWELEAPVNEEDFFRDPAATHGVATAAALHGQAGSRSAGQSPLLGHAGWQRWRSVLRHVPLPCRSRQPHPGPAQPQHQWPAGETRLPDRQASQHGCGGRRLPVSQGRTRRFHNRRRRRHVLDGRQPVQAVPRHPGHRPGELPSAGQRDQGTRTRRRYILPDPVPVMDGFRRVEPRNTPTFHGAAFNFDNFWDGRARFTSTAAACSAPLTPRPTSSSAPAAPSWARPWATSGRTC